MIVAAIGLTSLIYSSRDTFITIKWAGVAYLVFIGVMLFRRRFDASLRAGNESRSASSLYWQGFMTSASNPKAIIFFAALFPQFVNPSAPAPEQFLILGLTYLIIDGMFLCVYGAFAGWIAARFRHHVGRHLNRISGALLVVAAILLGLRDIELG